MSEALTPSTENLFDRVAAILDDARGRVVRAVNHEMVVAYGLIGREIVEHEQQGENRAAYGKQLIRSLSAQLTHRYGKGFSTANLGISGSFTSRFQIEGYQFTTQWVANLNAGFHTSLSWLHYRALMRMDDDTTFASRYKLALPDEHDLIAELHQEISLLSEKRQ